MKIERSFHVCVWVCEENRGGSLPQNEKLWFVANELNELDQNMKIFIKMLNWSKCTNLHINQTKHTQIISFADLIATLRPSEMSEKQILKI
jgi:hypothetical protein